MEIPNPFKIAKLMKKAIANKDKWEQVYDIHVTGQDKEKKVAAKFYLKTNRFVHIEQSSDSTNQDVLQAVNNALELADEKHNEAEKDFLS